MRRLIISLVMIVAIIAMSIFNIVTLFNTRNELTQSLTSMAQALEGGEAQDVMQETKDFQALWLRHEQKLIRFIRHSELDQITWDAARLPYLSRYGNISELTAEINRIYLQVEHLWETQVPRWSTIF